MYQTKYSLKTGVILRKECFGGLFLLGNGKRYFFSIEDYKKIEHILALPKKNNSLPFIGQQDFINELLNAELIVEGASNGILIKNKSLGKNTLTYPKIIYFEITNRCNLLCKHCYSNSGKIKNKELTKKEIFSLIDESAKQGLEFLSIGGGEPLLRMEIFEIIKKVIKKGIQVELVTNGTLISKDSIKKLSQTGLKYVQISLDGFDKESYMCIRRKDLFQEVINGINQLSKKFIVTVSTVLTKENYKHIEKIIKLSEKNGAKYFRVIKLMNLGRATNSDLAITEKEIKQTLEKLNKLKNKKIKIELDENILYPVRKTIFWLPRGVYGCSAGRSTCNINSIGDVFPCTFLQYSELNCGNIRKQTFSEIWKSSEILAAFRDINQLESPCNNCKHLKICLGGCRAEAYYKTRKINGGNKGCCNYE
jgi:AdoMet-dependent heme synthase